MEVATTTMEEIITTTERAEEVEAVAYLKLCPDPQWSSMY